MRLVCISDTHTLANGLDVPDGDVLVHSGDFTWNGSAHEIREFSDWLGALPHARKLVIAGNHDRLLEDDPEHAEALLRNCVYLRDNGITINGVSFWGSPWQPEFCNWAFNVERNSQRMRDIWAQVPTGVDVLITHGPPHGIRDECPDLYSEASISAGCEVLRVEVLGRIKPKIHVFGHIHSGYGVHKEGETVFVNAAVVDNSYNVVNPIQVVDL